MFHFRGSSALIAVSFALLTFFLILTALNTGMAELKQNATYPYQAPLFAFLDDNEGTTEEHNTEEDVILLNATLAQLPSSSFNGPLSGENSTLLGGGSQNINSFNHSGSFLLDDVPFEHFRTELNDIVMHYVMGGKGDPVVLLHGWPQTWYEWRHVMPILVKNNYTVIVPDLRGLGDTSRPGSGYDVKTTSADIYDLVSSLGFSNIHLVGHDIGARTAYSFSLTHPDNVSKLVVMDFVFPNSPTYESDSAPPWWFAFHRVPDLPEALVAGKERQYLSWFYNQLAYNPYFISDADIDEYVRHYSAPGGMRAGFEYFRNTTSDLGGRNTDASEFDLPILSISGEFSPALKRNVTDNTRPNSTGYISGNITSFVVPYSGHWIPEEQPEILGALLIGFFNGEIGDASLDETELNMLEKRITRSDNETLLLSEIARPGNLGNLSSGENIVSGNTSSQAIPIVGSVNETLVNQSSLRNLSETNLPEEFANQTTPGENDTSVQLTTNAGREDSLDQPDELIADQRTPLSEALEAITRLFSGDSSS